LAAEYTLDLLPIPANLFEVWRGREIVEEIEAKRFEGKNARLIRDARDRCRGEGSGPATHPLEGLVFLTAPFPPSYMLARKSRGARRSRPG